MPERAASQDSPRVSEDNNPKRIWRNSHQSTATVRQTAPPSIIERPSDEVPLNPSPSHQQLHMWQPPRQHSPYHHPIQETRHGRPGNYARSTSNDYTVYSGIETPTPVNHSTIPHSATTAIPYAGNAYFNGPGPYKRAGHVRDNTETGSIKAGRYTSFAHGGQTLRKSTNTNRPHWDDGYDPSMDDYYHETTPQKRPPRRARGSIYIVLAAAGGGDGGDGEGPEELMRLPFSGWMESSAKNHFVAVLGELVGTTMFLFFAFAGTLVANIGATESAKTTTTNETAGFNPLVMLYIAVSFGFSLMVNDPAVTLGMVMTKSITYVRGFLLVGAQMTGAILASFLVQMLFPSDFNVRTTLSSSTSVVRGVFTEAIFTAELVFSVFMLAKEKHKATYMAPVGIGLALFVAELVGVFFTGGSLNPARSFGPCVTTGQFDPEHWIYWVGPAIGAIAAFAFYRFIKILEYEMANPGQDLNAEEAELASLKSKEKRERKCE
ncbi:hypothetical protein LTR37_008032 [Vermiconidia calcicola]|uniref:Uncharacterized protein n=1 Tax=Vermiconidia calcicola TaxID=1690605 RepID=A0ACC3NCK1_9PEZI|nr:hypothetical protein LTR37_008032 [Vermiconidia calcicola]